MQFRQPWIQHNKVTCHTVSHTAQPINHWEKRFFNNPTQNGFRSNGKQPDHANDNCTQQPTAPHFSDTWQTRIMPMSAAVASLAAKHVACWHILCEWNASNLPCLQAYSHHANTVFEHTFSPAQRCMQPMRAMQSLQPMLILCNSLLTPPLQ
jgi:hypothetical protein